MSVIAARKYDDKIIFATDSIRVSDAIKGINPFVKDSFLESKISIIPHPKKHTIVTAFTGHTSTLQAFNMYLYSNPYVFKKKKLTDSDVYTYVAKGLRDITRLMMDDSYGSIILGLDTNIFLINIIDNGIYIANIKEYVVDGYYDEVVTYLFKKGFDPVSALKEVLIEYDRYVTCALPINVVSLKLNKKGKITKVETEVLYE